MKNIVFLVLFLLVSNNVIAAQFGKIVVSSAAVRQYPTATSPVIGEVVKDQELAVSNLPTENFYKVRLPDGTMGWVSGNDVLVSKTPFQQPLVAPAPRERMEQPPLESTHESVYADKSINEKSRIILAFGLANLSYGGFPSTIKADSLNMAMTALAEFQFKMSEYWFWAARAEFYTSSSGQLNLGSNVKENISQLMLPIQVGVLFSPITKKRFRLGAGLYLGLAAYSNTKVTLENGSNSYEVGYGSFDPVGTFAIQSNIGISDKTGVFIEGSYRYQQSGTFKETDLGSTIPPFKANYSGMVARAGLEFRLY